MSICPLVTMTTALITSKDLVVIESGFLLCSAESDHSTMAEGFRNLPLLYQKLPNFMEQRSKVTYQRIKRIKIVRDLGSWIHMICWYLLETSLTQGLFFIKCPLRNELAIILITIALRAVCSEGLRESTVHNYLNKRIIFGNSSKKSCQFAFSISLINS